MRTFVPYGVGLWVSVTGAAMAASGPSPSPKLRYSEEYTRYQCEQLKLGGINVESLFGADGKITDEAKEAWSKQAKAEERLRERFQSAISNPYPPELQGYKPKSFEFVEFLRNPGPCSAGRDQSKPTVRAGFRCRLDKVVLKDRKTGKTFLTVAALVDFDFIYGDGDKRKLEDEPRPLPSEPYTTVGIVTLKGTVDGTVNTMTHEWISGAPSETVTSTAWGSEEEKLEFTPPADLPVVTVANASIFSFDLKNEAPYIRDEYGGPLKEYSFEVYGCQS